MTGIKVDFNFTESTEQGSQLPSEIIKKLSPLLSFKRSDEMVVLIMKMKQTVKQITKQTMMLIRMIR